MERLNEEIRWGEPVERIFPHAARPEAPRPLLMEHHEMWSTGRKHFEMAAYWESRRPQATAAD